MYAEIYEISEFVGLMNGNPVNHESLRIEIQASPVPGITSLDGIQGRIFIQFQERISDDDKLILDQIISSHDGLPARTTKVLQETRSTILDNLVQMAHFHPVLKLNPDEITGYLTSIDNWLNAWRRDGNHTILISKIAQDANDNSNPHHGYLNEIVNTDGVRTYQFLIGGIPTTPYV